MAKRQEAKPAASSAQSIESASGSSDKPQAQSIVEPPPTLDPAKSSSAEPLPLVEAPKLVAEEAIAAPKGDAPKAAAAEAELAERLGRELDYVQGYRQAGEILRTLRS